MDREGIDMKKGKGVSLQGGTFSCLKQCISCTNRELYRAYRIGEYGKEKYRIINVNYDVEVVAE